MVDSLKLLVQDGALEQPQEQTICGPVIQVGRGSGNDVTVTDPRVSTIHGRFVLDSGKVSYKDLGSTNGSAVIRKGVRTALAKNDPVGTDIEPDDEVQLGDADRPTSIRLLEISLDRTDVTQATVVASRALGEMSGQADSHAFQSLLQLLASLRTEADLNSLIHKVLDFIIRIIPAVSKAECFMKDQQGKYSPFDQAACSELSTTLLERLENKRQALLVEDVLSEVDASKSMQSSSTRSLLLAPLICDTEMVGVLQVGAREGGRFGERELDLVSVLAQQLSSLLSGTKLIRRLKEAESRLQGQCDYLKDKLGHRPALEEMLGTGPAIMEVRRQIVAVAPSRATVLIQGETGTGKELVARAIHEGSPRATETFAAVNCSSLALGLLESELFGHVKGAFTGAHRDRKGLFEVANGGTLFLDEIGDMPAQLQPKLLRVLEDGTVQQVGSNKPKSVDVRVVTATHRDLEQEVEQGRFRQDLLFRLNVFTFQIPPLRERASDIQKLAEHFLASFAQEHNRPHAGFSAGAVAALESYNWPGNIRELKNEMERASLLAPIDEAVDRSHLSERLGGGDDSPLSMEGKLKEIMERLEKMVVKAALARHDGNRTRCAKALGISRQALISKIARLGL